MKALFVTALALVVLATALSTGWEISYRLAYTMVGVLILSYLSAWANVRGLSFRHEIRTPRAQVGGQIEERLTLENRSWLPKLWLEIREDSTLIGHRGNRVVALGSYAKRRFTLVTPCRVRGEFTLGPITVISGDPFGLFRRRRQLDAGGTVIVYPAMVELATFGRLSGELPGGAARTRRTHYVTPNAAGVRDYQPGDALSRIHWPSSARHGRLMAKEFELDPLSDVWLILDLHSDVQVGEGEDSTEEWGVSVCATLANYFVRQQREVGFLTQGEILVPDRGQRQLQRILELLAVVRSESNTPLERLAVAEERRFTRGSTAVVITPSADERWLATSRLLRARGVAVIAVLLEPSTFGAPQSSLLLVSSLVASGVQTYLVKRGDDLAQALTQPAGVLSDGR